MVEYTIPTNLGDVTIDISVLASNQGVKLILKPFKDNSDDEIHGSARKISITQRDLDNPDFTVGQGFRDVSLILRNSALGMEGDILMNSDSVFEVWSPAFTVYNRRGNNSIDISIYVSLFRNVVNNAPVVTFQYVSFDTESSAVVSDTTKRGIASTYYVANSQANTRDTAEIEEGDPELLTGYDFTTAPILTNGKIEVIPIMPPSVDSVFRDYVEWAMVKDDGTLDDPVGLLDVKGMYGKKLQVDPPAVGDKPYVIRRHITYHSQLVIRSHWLIYVRTRLGFHTYEPTADEKIGLIIDDASPPLVFDEILTGVPEIDIGRCV